MSFDTEDDCVVNREQRIINHRQRWSLCASKEEQFQELKNRVIGAIDQLLGQAFVDDFDLDERFGQEWKICVAEKPTISKSRVVSPQEQAMGDALTNLISSPLRRKSYAEKTTERGFGDTQIYQALDKASSFTKLITAIQVLFWVLEDYEELPRNNLAKRLRRESALSPEFKFHVAIRSERVLFYPAGSELLDEEVVDYVISGLELFPKSLRNFEKALDYYQSGNALEYRNLLDNLRFALEQLLRGVLGNRKALENNRAALSEWLKTKEVHSQVKNMYGTLLTQFIQYQNDAVKHDESYSLDEIEFMIYLTSTFMRLVLQLVD